MVEKAGALGGFQGGEGDLAGQFASIISAIQEKMGASAQNMSPEQMISTIEEATKGANDGNLTADELSEYLGIDKGEAQDFIDAANTPGQTDGLDKNELTKAMEKAAEAE